MDPEPGPTKLDGAKFRSGLVPFAWIAFWWFIGVMLGSGLLYLALAFVSVPLAGGFLATTKAPTQALESGLYDLNRSVICRNVDRLACAGRQHRGCAQDRTITRFR